MRLCEPPSPLNAEEKSRLLRFGAVIKAELESSGQPLALVARSGLDLSRFGLRYSHAGLSLKASPDTPWAVRQLYYACDERQPRIYDQGMAAFLMGSHEARVGYVSAVLLPDAEGAELARAALDNPTALQVLGPVYSANSYPFNLRYQNCNQWVMELLAAAWGRPGTDRDPRAQAQGWLKERGYEPSLLDVGWRPLMWLGELIPWVHSDDHPAQDLAQSRYRVSMPASIEAFVRAQVPGATRLEFCHTEAHVVVHRGWDEIAEGCVPGEQDAVFVLD
ncbi:MAG: DUF2145 domain-containing protein [Rubrivivax sp.]|nr:DUF2145 domain-containing protein [Rubrivivax sp.]